MTNKVNRKRQSGGGDNCQNKYRKGCSARLCHALPDCICFSQLLAHMYTDNNTHMYVFREEFLDYRIVQHNCIYWHQKHQKHNLYFIFDVLLVWFLHLYLSLVTIAFVCWQQIHFICPISAPPPLTSRASSGNKSEATRLYLYLLAVVFVLIVLFVFQFCWWLYFLYFICPSQASGKKKKTVRLLCWSD